MSSKNSNISFKYHNYDINIDLNDIKWSSFREYPNNIQHHLFSLRWIAGYPEDMQSNIANQFCRYFYKINEAIEYLFYLGKYADHTASIRIKILLKILENSMCKEEYQLLNFELHKTFKSIYDGKTYSPGSNHSIMSDLALLNCSSKVRATNEVVTNIKNRLINNIDSIFNVHTGASKEHSISYQEFNLLLIHNTLNEISALSNDIIHSKDIQFINSTYLKVKRFSKFILYSSWLNGLGYLPIGDTFSTCKPNILKKVFGVNNPNELFDGEFLPIVFFSKSFGLYIYKTEYIQLSLQNSFHSLIHKQNDDLSITLSVNGEPFFIDGGYHDILTGSLKLKSTNCHSMPICKDIKLKNSMDFKSGSLIEISDDMMSICAEHSRYGELIIKRDISIESGCINIKDTINVFDQRIITQFILAPELKLKLLTANSIEIKSNTTKITLIFTGEVIIDEIEVIFKDLPCKVNRIAIQNVRLGLFTVMLTEKILQLIEKPKNFFTDDKTNLIEN
jgi:hypothetical protein